MGMFDELRCEYPLPDAIAQHAIFQTKDFDCVWHRFTIEADGRLTCRMAVWIGVDETAPPETVVEWPHHGYLNFYTFLNDDSRQWYEYNAKFTDGRCVGIERVVEVVDGR